ncbi:response regulator [Seongchinamella sediminis]|uniref:Response regulator n=1 Tax=Seongchinamella sediminis TaxID=2283635 RepID=A0A3L7E2H0_9GAMM|nr:response regulator [Seongchinamella sediminis]RLQ22392.1 response regulator [Seongchinamella sediminis]
MTEQLTVFVVDDDQDFRDSLIWLLEGAGFNCSAFDCAEAFLTDYAGQPGCLLLDIRMPGLSGLQLQQQLNRTSVALPVILMTGHGNVAWAVEGMKNRAVDFIEKPFDDEALLTLVADTLQLARQRFAEAGQRAQLQEHWDSLSRREKQVAELVVRGMANKEIAEQLAITIKTVEAHRSRAMKKMDCSSLANFVDVYRSLSR